MSDIDDKDFAIRAPYVQKILELEAIIVNLRLAGAGSQLAQSRSTARLGAAVIVRGQIIAWFANFNEEARDWCTYNHFGEWLVWRATHPELVPLTDAEDAEVRRRAAELSAKLQEVPDSAAQMTVDGNGNNG